MTLEGVELDDVLGLRVVGGRELGLQHRGEPELGGQVRSLVVGALRGLVGDLAVGLSEQVLALDARDIAGVP